MDIVQGRIFNAIVLNEPYAEMVRLRIKTIETRMKRLNLTGDLIICCDGGKSKESKNAGKAICLVEVRTCRDMVISDEQHACIEWVPGRIAYPLTQWRYFSYDFKFTDYKVSGSYQSIFQIKLPDFVKIIPAYEVVLTNETKLK